jgi:hypothetical protein
VGPDGGAPGDDALPDNVMGPVFVIVMPPVVAPPLLDRTISYTIRPLFNGWRKDINK